MSRVHPALSALCSALALAACTDATSADATDTGAAAASDLPDVGADSAGADSTGAPDVAGPDTAAPDGVAPDEAALPADAGPTDADDAPPAPDAEGPDISELGPLDPTCSPNFGYHPALLNAAAAALGAPADLSDCGCAPFDTNGTLVVPGGNECFCAAFATCTPARLRVLQDGVAGPTARDLFVVRDGVGGCTVTQLTDGSQSPAGGAEVTSAWCRGLSCDAALPTASECADPPVCAAAPRCVEPQAKADTDADGCFDECCLQHCAENFVLADNNGDGCPDACADKPCAGAGDCLGVRCAFFPATCEAPKGICSNFACDPGGPVCGCDGVTYESGCDADVAGVPVATKGPCAP